MCTCPPGHHTIYCHERPEPPLLPDEAIGRPVGWEPTGGPQDLEPFHPPALAEPEEDYGPLDEVHPRELPRLDPTRLRYNLTNHAPRGTQVQRYERIREEGVRFSILLTQLAPESNELVRAVDLVDDAVRLAIAAIARNEP